MMSDLFPHAPSCTQWPWMLPPETPGTPARDRRRKRGHRLLAALLARFRPRAGDRDAPPQAAPVPLPREPEPDGRDPMETKLDLWRWREERVRLYIDEPRGAHRARRGTP